MGDERTPTEAADAHTALVGSRVGRFVVASLVAVTGLWIIGPNMPPGPARDSVDVLWSPATNAGLEQNWEVFSPNPRSQSIVVEALLDYADGSSAVWSTPDFDPVIGAYRGYRWRKWQERVRLDVNSAYWDSSAAWIAEQNRRDGELPTAVRLIRRWRDHEPLTSQGAVDQAENSFEFHVWTPDP